MLVALDVNGNSIEYAYMCAMYQCINVSPPTSLPHTLNPSIIFFCFSVFPPIAAHIVAEIFVCFVWGSNTVNYAYALC